MRGREKSVEEVGGFDRPAAGNDNFAVSSFDKLKKSG
jgi:hypothetical protein